MEGLALLGSGALPVREGIVMIRLVRARRHLAAAAGLATVAAMTLVCAAPAALSAPRSAAAGAPGVGALTGTGGWGKAEKVPGLAAHFKNTHWTAAIKSLSCSSPGNCTAGGYYQATARGDQALRHARAFVVSQDNGRWGRAVTVPGITALSTGGDAQVSSVSCTRGGCAAAGYYTDAARHVQGFVTGQRHGRWQHATEVPGLAALNAGGDAVLNSVSCPSAGNCTAGGSFTGENGDVQGFVVNQRHGRWQHAEEVPGLKAMNVGGDAVVSSVRCASAGDCAAGGQYEPSTAPPPEFSADIQPFVVSEHDGIWSGAIEVPGIQPINTGEQAGVTASSCPSPGNCTVGGYFYDNNGDGPFLNPWAVSQHSGHWGNAVMLAAHAGGTGYLGPLATMSCPSPGNCTGAGLGIGNGAGTSPPWLVIQHNGKWGKPVEIPATASDGAIYSVSCPSVGNCTAVGNYEPGSGAYRTLLVSERHGRWGKPGQVPGIKALTKGRPTARVDFVSCPLVGKCTAAGSYDDFSRTFVVSQVR